MTTPAIDDPALAGFALALQPDKLTPYLSSSLAEATDGKWSVQNVSVVRYRYRAGSRAIVQTDLSLFGPNGHLDAPGSIWFFAGDKAKKHAARAPKPGETGLPPMFVEPHSGGLVSIFPFDRRVPQLQQFANDSENHAGVLLGCKPTGQPRIVRYRPGLGGTFRWKGIDRTAYVKIFTDRSASGALAQLRAMGDVFGSTNLTIPEPIGAVDALGALSIAEVDGPSLLDIIGTKRTPELGGLMVRVADALHYLHGSTLQPDQSRGASGFIKRANGCATLIAAASPTLGKTARTICADLTNAAPPLASAPAHMDMKLEHVVPQGDKISLLDLDSIATSDPLFDLAMLDARIVAVARRGGCTDEQGTAARNALLKRYLENAPSHSAAPYRWLRAIASLQIAKHHVQHPAPGWDRRAAEALADAWQEPPSILAD